MTGFIEEARARSSERARLARSPPQPGSLRAAVEGALREGRPGLIVEYKRCSPRGFTSYMTPWQFHTHYGSVADAYSALVEPYWFCGSPEVLAWLAQHKPTLAKDLAIDEAQIDAHRAYGASATLLIVDLLGWRKLDYLYNYASSLGLEALIEVSSGKEAVEVLNSYPEALMGINARDLHTLKVSFEGMLNELMWAAERKPSRSVLVAESGIDSARKALLAAKAGADALLIGTWAMADPSSLSRLRKTLHNIRKA